MTDQVDKAKEAIAQRYYEVAHEEELAKWSDIDQVAELIEDLFPMYRLDYPDILGINVADAIARRVVADRPMVYEMANDYASNRAEYVFHMGMDLDELLDAIGEDRDEFAHEFGLTDDDMDELDARI